MIRCGWPPMAICMDPVSNPFITMDEKQSTLTPNFWLAGVGRWKYNWWELVFMDLKECMNPTGTWPMQLLIKVLKDIRGFYGRKPIKFLENVGVKRNLST